MGIRSTRLIGRDRELGALSQALEKARTDHGGAFFLVGEGGIGKSRLAADVAARALATGMPVLRGRASSIGPMVPFRPLAEALLSHFRGGHPPAAPELDPLVPVLARLVPDWYRGDRPHDNGSLMVLAEAVFRLLSVAGRAEGCLIVLEDLHNADAETLFIVEYLVDNLASGKVMLIGTLRNEPGEALRLATAASQRSSSHTFELTRLNAARTREFAAACLETEPDAVPAAVANLLWQNSEGVPFVVEELLHGMLGDGLLVGGPGGWQVVGELQARVPEALISSIATRVDALGSDGETLLSVAAVLGRRFPLSVVQAVTDMDDRMLHNHISASVAAHLVTTDETTPGWYAFRHPLTAEALLSRLVPSTKANLARKAADAVELLHPGLPGELCALAASLRLTAMDHPGAGRLFAEAGRRARDGGAADTAVTMLTRAVELLAAAGTEDRADALEALLHALGQTGQFDRAVEFSARFAELGRLERAVDLHIQLAWAAYIAGRHDECLNQIEQARAPLGDEMAEEQRAAVDAVEATLWLDVPGPAHTERARKLAEQAWQVAERAGVPFVSCQALQVLGMVALETDLAEAERYLQLARRLAERHQLTHLRTQVLVRLGGHRMLAEGDVRTFDLARAEAQRTGAITLTCAVDASRAVHAVMRGEFAQADRILAENLAVLGRLRLVALLQYTHMTRAMVAAHQADRPRMELALDDFRAEGGGTAQEMVLSVGLAQVFCSLLEEDADRARRELAQVMALEERQPSRFHLAGQHGLRLLIEALDGIEPEPGEPRAAVSGMRWNRQFVLLGEAVRHGRAGEVELADAALAQAVDAAALFPVSRHLGLRMVAESAAADGWGDPVTWLKEAEEYFHQAGISAVASACRGLLRKIGAPVGQRREGSDRLPADLRSAGVTVREYEVLQLLADNMGNKDIARRLHISPRTVEKHVASLMAKSNLQNRTALTEYASRSR
ncbi:AAA family ATPase [Amycolatopsis sp. NBC_00355]|uniref:helix-turn-helix transcriptional regulator n=1 Tax=Amycolatopsis sp. NBC_00355 TaxID=2975957 RepID=UPI002E252F53